MANKITDDELRFMYGQNVIITRKGEFTFVHLDAPSPELRNRRTREVDPETFFACDCRICQLTKDGGVVVFDDTDVSTEE